MFDRQCEKKELNSDEMEAHEQLRTIARESLKTIMDENSLVAASVYHYGPSVLDRNAERAGVVPHQARADWSEA
jgi:division protein CdvB (Snf7/Vps24/ESCRT-III family)